MFLVKEIIERNEEIYSEEEIKNYCPQLFNYSSFSSIKEMPSKYLDIYFKNYPEIKNIRNMHPNIVTELIDGNYLKETYFCDIIKTGKIELVKYFLKKLSIDLSASKI